MFKKKHFYKVYLNCKRGMLELDIILLNFLELEYFNLDNKHAAQFEMLLNNSDQDLYLWLVKRELCTDFYLTDIICKIKTVTSNLIFN